MWCTDNHTVQHQSLISEIKTKHNIILFTELSEQQQQQHSQNHKLYKMI